MQGGTGKERGFSQVVGDRVLAGGGTGRRRRLGGDQPAAAWSGCGHLPELTGTEACTEPGWEDGLSMATGPSRHFVPGPQLLTSLPLHHALANRQSALRRPPELAGPAPLWERKGAGGFQGNVPFLWPVRVREAGSGRGLTPSVCPEALTPEEAL